MFKCQDLQNDLPLYFDGVLSTDELGRLDAHLVQCPLCRQRLSEFETLGRTLRTMKSETVPADLVSSIRAAVLANLNPQGISLRFGLAEKRGTWWETWMMPSVIGGFASLLIGFTLLWTMLTSVPQSEIARSQPQSLNSSIMIADPTGRDYDDLTPLEYANTRLDISSESPSVNPQGALIALTRSLVRGEMKDEEVVVVADVYGDGLARITEVVEPSQENARTIEALNAALQSDPRSTPFVPASYDQRSGDTVRVVLKIQNVNVPLHLGASGL